MKRRLWPIALGLSYVGLIALLGGLRGDHLLIGGLAFLDAYNPRTRLFLKYFLPFILTGAVFDSMRYYYWPNIAGHVHVAEPYLRDKLWFGIKGKTMNEFWAEHSLPALDLACGFAYLFFIAEYLLAAFFLFFSGRLYLLRIFGGCFLTANVLGFITYFIYPAAPPWYVQLYGLGPARMDVHPHPAAALRFDSLLGTHFFSQIYGRGVDVFGAYPSLHVAYPLLVVWVCFQLKLPIVFRALTLAFFFLMCFSAVYLQHHYGVDILLGCLYAGLSIALVKWMDSEFFSKLQKWDEPVVLGVKAMV